MTSINTNIAAVTALRTLQNTNMALDATQGRISTGLKIGEAKDNAAYWAISTTLKSDNKALSTVKDALGLGAATVDTAYQGLNKAKEVLDELKSKLTAATQDGVDKAAVQSEINELQNQLKAIATSSSFSGENWLSINSGLAGYSADKQIVSSFSRDMAGNIALGTIGVDISNFALVDGSVTGEAILDAGKVGNTLRGGLDVGSDMGAATAGTTNQAAFAYATGTGGTAGTATLAGTLAIDGSSFAFNLTEAHFFFIVSVTTEIYNLIGGSGTATNDGTDITITSATTGTTSTVALTGVTFTAQTGSTGGSFAGLATTAAVAGTADAAVVTMAGAFAGPVSLDANDEIAFDLAANGKDAVTVRINRETVIAALGEVSVGSITTANQYASVISKALLNAGISDVTASVNAGAIRFTSSVVNASSALNISRVAASKGQSILTIDVTGASAATITSYLEKVSDAVAKVTSAASTLGSVAKRIDLQQSFVDTLMDTIDKGVSGLIDADMNEESTRLQALQVKQQLGVQALSIANQSAQNILSLFRS